MKPFVLSFCLLLSACAMTPEDARIAGIHTLCGAVVQGDRESAHNASQEIKARGYDPSGCFALVQARRAEAMQMIGLGSGVLLSSQPRPQEQCTTIYSYGVATTTCR